MEYKISRGHLLKKKSVEADKGTLWGDMEYAGAWENGVLGILLSSEWLDHLMHDSGNEKKDLV